MVPMLFRAGFSDSGAAATSLWSLVGGKVWTFSLLVGDVSFVLRLHFLIGVGVEYVISLKTREPISFTRLKALSERIIPTSTDVDVRLRV